MDIKAILELVGENPKLDEIKTGIEGLIDGVKEVGIEKTRKLNSEAKGLRTKFNTLKESLVNEGIDFEGDISEQIKKLNGSGSNEELTELRKKVGALELTNKDLLGQNENYKVTAEKGKLSRVEGALTKSLIGAGALNPKDTISMIAKSGQVFIDDNDEMVIKNGDNVVSFDKGIDNFVNSLKEEERIIIGTTQKGGAEGGSTGGTQSNEPSNLLEALNSI